MCGTRRDPRRHLRELARRGKKVVTAFLVTSRVHGGERRRAFLLPAMPQPVDYHAFADDRRLVGVANFLDVVSNAAFVSRASPA